jgi:hypothetical protein
MIITTDMSNKNKEGTAFSIDPDALKGAREKAQFYGYRSTSDLVNDLLTKWVKNPTKKEAK